MDCTTPRCLVRLHAPASVALAFSLVLCPLLSPAQAGRASRAADQGKVASASAAKKAPPAADWTKSRRAQGAPNWEDACRADARKTVETGVASVLRGVADKSHLAETVRIMRRDWEDDWKVSGVFVLKDERDLDAYGNLFSLKVLCRTLRLASEAWNAEEKSGLSRLTLKKAQWLEQQSAGMAEAVAAIIREQSFSDYLPRCVEIMEEEFRGVDAVFRREAGAAAAR